MVSPGVQALRCGVAFSVRRVRCLRWLCLGHRSCLVVRRRSGRGMAGAGIARHQAGHGTGSDMSVT
eukprot:8149472-Alexandrium_andersonii.AAC.1